ncbi:MAG: nucleotidyltransferase domain-containing protein [Muribaculaceae bacterium]|nr:nucleotidyltransferase domain-containing protein [Muribaculaceae bacterium]
MINKNISELIPAIRAYFKDKPIVRAWLFGSCSRGEESADSDIDILVDYDDSKGIVSLFKMGGYLMDLSELLGRRVDLVDNKGLKNFARSSVEHDKILIYERAG